IWRMIDEPEHKAPPRDRTDRSQSLSPWHMLAERNVLLCSIISCFAVGSAVIGSIFMPFYLDGPLGIPPATWKWMMAVVGLCPAVGAVLFTAMSDRIGRKPPMIIGGTMMAIGPLALLLMPGTPATFTAMMFIGWM